MILVEIILNNLDILIDLKLIRKEELQIIYNINYILAFYAFVKKIFKLESWNIKYLLPTVYINLGIFYFKNKNNFQS